MTSRGDNRQISKNWDASVRARLGYLITPSFLLFASGGGSWEHINISALCDGTASGGIIGYCANFGFPSQTIAQSMTRGGWTVGAGFEAMLSAHWIARADYRFSDYHHGQRNNHAAGLRPDLHLRPQAADARRRVRSALQVLIDR